MIPGLLPFLPVPLVLWLFTWAPLGPGPSLAAGVLVMATHRLYARPFARLRAGRRCLFCGGSAGEAVPLPATDPLGTVPWVACSSRHADAMRSVLDWAERHARPLRVGILGTLLVFLIIAGAGAAGLPVLPHADAVALFRFGVAVSVLPLGWLSLRGDARPVDTLRSPFPLHVPALIGTRAVLWLFRLVGVWWLAAALLHVVDRLQLLG